MDKSLSDFQEKKNFSGPKNTLTLEKNKIISKNRKPKKPVKGQKDIRSALKKQNNDLLCYTKDFNNICKHSGIDIDGEQLQLAIALSKSLQQPESISSDVQVSNSLTSQERTGKIRITLQEYGFKIPESKIPPSNIKRSRKINKCSKLILTTQTEKQQIIADKYTQVLFKNTDSCKTVVESDVYPYSTNELTLFQKTANIAYNAMKNSHIFYVLDIIEKCSNCMGNLLRDWSEIPGRPISPPLHECVKMNISEIECSQDELDIVLSGSLKSCKNVLNSKQFNVKDHIKGMEEYSIIPNKNVPIAESKSTENTTIKYKIQCDKNQTKHSLALSPKINFGEVTNVKDKSNKRSTSPDIFDDEVYPLTEKTNTTVANTPSQKSKNNFGCKSQDMDFTECVTTAGILQSENFANVDKVVMQISKDDNTKRKSNDFMEITECVITFSEPICTVISNIDLTQSPDKDNSHPTAEKKKDNLEITHSSDEDTLPFVNLSRNKQNLLDDTIILDDDEYLSINCNVEKIAAVNELNSINTNKLNMCAKNEESKKHEELCLPEEKNFENYVYHHSHNNSICNFDSGNLSDSISENNITQIILKKKSQIIDKAINDCTENDVSHDNNVIDLSQNSNSDSELNVQTVYSDIDKESNLGNYENTSKTDLTQDSDSSSISLRNDSIKITNSQLLVEESGLGRNFDVSVDYDEIIDLNKINEFKENYDNCTIEEDKPFNEGKSNINKTNNTSSDINTSEGNEIINNDVNNVEHGEILVPYSIIAGTSTLHNITETSLKYLKTAQDANKPKRVSFTPESKRKGIEILEDDVNNWEHHEIPVSNFNFGGISILDNINESRKESLNTVQNIDKHKNVSFKSGSGTTSIEFKNVVLGKSTDTKISPDKICTPYKEFIPKNVAEVTPNNKYLIKTEEITPLLDYESMSTPERNKELEKYGLKPFKRKRAVQLLKHLYNQTHPIVEQCSSGQLSSPSKKRKYNNSNAQANAPSKQALTRSPKKLKSPKKAVEEEEKAICRKENNMYAVTKELPDIKLLECNPEDWIFQKREKAKVHSCRVPLHIAFHNYVSCRRALREAILRYEPVNIEVVHKELTACGLRYDPKDLLKFLDKKCITVKTAGSNSRKRH